MPADRGGAPRFGVRREAADLPMNEWDQTSFHTTLIRNLGVAVSKPRAGTGLVNDA